MVPVAIIESVTAGSSAVDDIRGSRFLALGWREVFEISGILASEGSGLSVDSAEEEILVKIESLITLKTSTSAETLNTGLHPPRRC